MKPSHNQNQNRRFNQNKNMKNQNQNRNNNGPPSRQQAHNNNQFMCYACNKPGHMARNCRNHIPIAQANVIDEEPLVAMITEINMISGSEGYGGQILELHDIFVMIVPGSRLILKKNT